MIFAHIPVRTGKYWCDELDMPFSLVGWLRENVGREGNDWFIEFEPEIVVLFREETKAVLFKLFWC